MESKKTRKPSAKAATKKTKVAKASSENNVEKKSVHYELVISSNKENGTNITFDNRKDAESVMFRNFLNTADELNKNNVVPDVMVFDAKEGRSIMSINVDDDKSPIYEWEIVEIAE